LYNSAIFFAVFTVSAGVKQEHNQFVILKPEEVHRGKPRYIPMMVGTRESEKVIFDRKNPSK
jgi:hypothetical protein